MGKKDQRTESLIIESLDQLQLAARHLLKFAGEIRILIFSGEMGAGKTTFIKAVCTELGVTEGMSSPTFSIINEYLSSTSAKIYHFDFYRIRNEAEAYEIGAEEYFHGGCFCMIEWPEKIINLLPEPRVRVNIQNEHNKRLITFSYE